MPSLRSPLAKRQTSSSSSRVGDRPAIAGLAFVVVRDLRRRARRARGGRAQLTDALSSPSANQVANGSFHSSVLGERLHPFELAAHVRPTRLGSRARPPRRCRAARSPARRTRAAAGSGGLARRALRWLRVRGRRHGVGICSPRRCAFGRRSHTHMVRWSTASMAALLRGRVSALFFLFVAVAIMHEPMLGFSSRSRSRLSAAGSSRCRSWALAVWASAALLARRRCSAIFYASMARAFRSSWTAPTSVLCGIAYGFFMCCVTEDVARAAHCGVIRRTPLWEALVGNDPLLTGSSISEYIDDRLPPARWPSWLDPAGLGVVRLA